jgi:hypothetical protein
MTTTQTTYWLIESTGDTRMVWKAKSPTLAGAKKEAGARHAVCTGEGLGDGQTMPRGQLKMALESGRIRIADGSSADGLC